jgi:hypothetical protein
MKETLFDYKLALISIKHEQWQTLVFSHYSCSFACVSANNTYFAQAQLQGRKEHVLSKESKQTCISLLIFSFSSLRREFSDCRTCK